MVDKREWKEFREMGLLWWINMVLHTFGWAIVFSFDEGGELGEVYPARVKYRGFNEKSNDEGYTKVSKYLSENATDLLKDCDE